MVTIPYKDLLTESKPHKALTKGLKKMEDETTLVESRPDTREEETRETSETLISHTTRRTFLQRLFLLSMIHIEQPSSRL